MKRLNGRAMCKIVLTLNLCLLVHALPSMQNSKLSNDLVKDESGSSSSGSDESGHGSWKTTRAGSMGRNNEAQSKCGYEVCVVFVIYQFVRHDYSIPFNADVHFPVLPQNKS